MCGVREEHGRLTAPMSREYCPTCGAETREGARFCYQCGAALQADAIAMPANLTSPTPLALANAPSGTIAPMMAPIVPPPSVPYPPYSPYPPYPLMPDARAPQRSRMATAGFCLGLVAVTIGIILTWLGTIIGLCGFIFSIIGIGETNPRSNHPMGLRTGRGFAIAGAILSVLGIIGSILLLIYILQNAERFGIQLPRSVGR